MTDRENSQTSQMNEKIYSVITAVGSYIPTEIITNDYFYNNEFYNSNNEKIVKSNPEIISKFFEITGIRQRRYITDDLVTSDIGYIAAKNAIESWGKDKETIDCIIFAHNFGDVAVGGRNCDMVPSLASRVKMRLGIENPYCSAFDMIFGCPGWILGVTTADDMLKAGTVKTVLVIGAETLSRVSDPADIDSMLYADGAGAVIIEAVRSSKPLGVIRKKNRSDSFEYSNLLYMEHSFNPAMKHNGKYLKMKGHQLYKYALTFVPDLVKDCIDSAGATFDQIKMIFFHQANAKMNEEIFKRLLNLYGLNGNFEEKMSEIVPMAISELGNSSVATIPTLFDLFKKGRLEGYNPEQKGIYVFVSVGAGMNINAFVYNDTDIVI